jgi:hypothetical protein
MIMGIKISALTSVGTPALSDVFPIVQAGVTYKESFTQLSSLFATAGANSNITSMDGLTGYLQAPLGIKDSSGNVVMAFLETASAVNYIAVINQSAGFNPGFIAAGSDTNVSMNLQTKGTGVVTTLTTSNTGLSMITGTTYRHLTNFNFADTATTRTITFLDASGDAVIAVRADGTEAANAVTASGTAGVITTSALVTAGGASYAITWTNTFISATSVIQLTLMGGTNTTKNITIEATAGAGTSTLTIYNNTAATNLNGNILIGYLVV